MPVGQRKEAPEQCVHGAIAEADRVATLVHDLALAVENTIMKNGKGIVEKQFIQERLANAAIEIFMATSVLSRTTWMLAMGPFSTPVR